MLDAMKRVQLEFDDELWAALQAKAADSRTSVSELVQVAARERYLGEPEEREIARMGIVGLWKDRSDLPDTETYIRALRQDQRLERLGVE